MTPCVPSPSAASPRPPALTLSLCEGDLNTPLLLVLPDLQNKQHQQHQQHQPHQEEDEGLRQQQKDGLQKESAASVLLREGSYLFALNMSEERPEAPGSAIGRANSFYTAVKRSKERMPSSASLLGESGAGASVTSYLGNKGKVAL
jgi:hypothetical protein